MSPRFFSCAMSASNAPLACAEFALPLKTGKTKQSVLQVSGLAAWLLMVSMVWTLQWGLDSWLE
jgi:hypothetical protein